VVSVMKKHILVIILLTGLITATHAMPRIGILPFTGGLGVEGETMANMLSSRQEIRGAFVVVPLPDEIGSIVSEHLLQASAFTDSDAAAVIGRAIGVDYVMSGHMRRLGNRHLVIATVVNVHTLELVAGYYRMYRNFREVNTFLPSMSRNLVGATLGRSVMEPLPRLAIAPLGVSPDDSAAETPVLVHTEADMHDLETLVQILAIRIVDTGEYAVLPRATVMRSALSAWEARMADERAAALERLIELLLGILDAPDEVAATEEYSAGAITAMGQAAGADLVLSVEMRGLEGVTMFAAQMHQTRDGDLREGISRGYRNMGEGVNLMAEIAVLLTNPESAPERIAALDSQRRRANLFDDSARFWSLGVSAGTSFADPWAIATVHGTLAPLPFSFFRVGFDLGFISEVEGVNHYSLYPFVQYALFLPFARGGIYIGAGGGFLLARHHFGPIVDIITGPFADFTAGLNIGNVFDVSYTLRTNFSIASSKVSAGFTHRFRLRGTR